MERNISHRTQHLNRRPSPHLDIDADVDSRHPKTDTNTDEDLDPDVATGPATSLTLALDPTAPAEMTRPQASLVVLKTDGTDGNRYTLDEREGHDQRRWCVLGCHPECDIIIKSKGVANLHALVCDTPNGPFVFGLDPALPTVFPAKKVSLFKDDGAQLGQGDSFLVGERKFRFELHPHADVVESQSHPAQMPLSDISSTAQNFQPPESSPSPPSPPSPTFRRDSLVVLDKSEVFKPAAKTRTVLTARRMSLPASAVADHFFATTKSHKSARKARTVAKARRPKSPVVFASPPLKSSPSSAGFRMLNGPEIPEGARAVEGDVKLPSTPPELQKKMSPLDDKEREKELRMTPRRLSRSEGDLHRSTTPRRLPIATELGNSDEGPWDGQDAARMTPRRLYPRSAEENVMPDNMANALTPLRSAGGSRRLASGNREVESHTPRNPRLTPRRLETPRSARAREDERDSERINKRIAAESPLFARPPKRARTAIKPPRPGPTGREVAFATPARTRLRAPSRLAQKSTNATAGPNSAGQADSGRMDLRKDPERMDDALAEDSRGAGNGDILAKPTTPRQSTRRAPTPARSGTPRNSKTPVRAAAPLSTSMPPRAATPGRSATCPSAATPAVETTPAHATTIARTATPDAAIVHDQQSMTLPRESNPHHEVAEKADSTGRLSQGTDAVSDGSKGKPRRASSFVRSVGNATPVPGLQKVASATRTRRKSQSSKSAEKSLGRSEDPEQKSPEKKLVTPRRSTRTTPRRSSNSGEAFNTTQDIGTPDHVSPMFEEAAPSSRRAPGESRESAEDFESDDVPSAEVMNSNSAPKSGKMTKSSSSLDKGGMACIEEPLTPSKKSAIRALQIPSPAASKYVDASAVQDITTPKSSRRTDALLLDEADLGEQLQPSVSVHQIECDHGVDDQEAEQLYAGITPAAGMLPRYSSKRAKTEGPQGPSRRRSITPEKQIRSVSGHRRCLSQKPRSAIMKSARKGRRGSAGLQKTVLFADSHGGDIELPSGPHYSPPAKPRSSQFCEEAGLPAYSPKVSRQQDLFADALPKPSPRTNEDFRGEITSQDEAPDGHALGPPPTTPLGGLGRFYYRVAPQFPLLQNGTPNRIEENATVDSDEPVDSDDPLSGSNVVRGESADGSLDSSAQSSADEITDPERLPFTETNEALNPRERSMSASPPRRRSLGVAGIASMASYAAASVYRRLSGSATKSAKQPEDTMESSAGGEFVESEAVESDAERELDMEDVEPVATAQYGMEAEFDVEEEDEVAPSIVAAADFEQKSESDDDDKFPEIGSSSSTDQVMPPYVEMENETRSQSQESEFVDSIVPCSGSSIVPVETATTPEIEDCKDSKKRGDIGDESEDNSLETVDMEAVADVTLGSSERGERRKSLLSRAFSAVFGGSQSNPEVDAQPAESEPNPEDDLTLGAANGVRAPEGDGLDGQSNGKSDEIAPMQVEEANVEKEADRAEMDSGDSVSPLKAPVEDRDEEPEVSSGGTDIVQMNDHIAVPPNEELAAAKILSAKAVADDVHTEDKAKFGNYTVKELRLYLSGVGVPCTGLKKAELVDLAYKTIEPTETQEEVSQELAAKVPTPPEMADVEPQPEQESSEEDLSKLKVADLQHRLKGLGLDTVGRKADLILRLQDASGPPAIPLSPARNEVAADLVEMQSGGDGAKERLAQVVSGYSVCTVKQLRVLLEDRELSSTGRKQELIDRLEEADCNPPESSEEVETAGANVEEDSTSDGSTDVDFDSWTVGELREELKRRGLSTAGRKGELLDRVKQSGPNGSEQEQSSAKEKAADEEEREVCLDPTKMTVAELKAVLREKGLCGVGKKAILVERLEQSQATGRVTRRRATKGDAEVCAKCSQGKECKAFSQ